MQQCPHSSGWAAGQNVRYLVVAADWNGFFVLNSEDKVFYIGVQHTGSFQLALSRQRNKLASCWRFSAAAYKRADSQPAFWAATLDIRATLSADVR